MTDDLTFIKKNDELFVYGTLRKGERADLSKYANKFSVEYLGRDEINGLLYHLGAYPGFKRIPDSDYSSFFPRESVVLGEVFLCKDASAGALLDAYEGYPHLYERAQVISKEGRLVWVYCYNGMVSPDQLIETGDWKNPRLAVTKRMPIITVGE